MSGTGMDFKASEGIEKLRNVRFLQYEQFFQVYGLFFLLRTSIEYGLILFRKADGSYIQKLNRK